MVLVLHMQIQGGLRPGAGLKEHVHEPRGKGVGIHGKGGYGPGGNTVSERLPRFRFKDLHLSRHAQQD